LIPVTDEQGNPLTGVTIVVKGTTRGTASDINGNHTIEDIDPLITFLLNIFR